MPVNDLIQFRRGTDWSIDPILSGGEPGFDLANNILKIGDGTSRWSELIAINGSGVGSGTSVAVTGSSVFDYINITGAGTTIVSISDNLLIISGVDGFSFRDYEDVTTTKTIFDIGQTYNSGFLDVYYNGLKLLINEDYYANGGTTFQLIENAASGDIVEWVGGYTGSSFFQDIGGSGITNYITKWKDKNTLTTGLLYDDGTKVGIGTDNPTTLLHLVNPGTGLLANDREATILLTTEASGSYAGFLLRDFNNKNAASFQYGNSGALAFTNEFVIASRQSGIPIVFYQGGISDENKRFILDSSGNAILANCNVGIGTSSPSYQLDLVGTGNFETLSINNAFIFPSLDGASGEFLIANGSGLVLWSGLDIIKDTSPQLGGDLDINSNNIVGTGHISISGDITAISGALDVLSFNIDNESILTKGQISWDDTEGTMDIGLTDNTTIHIGEHRYFRIRNETGGVLYKGQVVYATGVHSNGLITPSKYVADGSVREVRFMGAVLEDVNNQNNGYVVDFGHLQDMDLDGSASNYAVGDETWVAGDILYVHPTVAGKLTKVEPKHSISVGIVLDPGNGNGNGRMFVRPTSYGHLDDNHDVNTSGVLNGQMLRYITSDDIWTTGIIYDNGTNVGIGTASPVEKLHVVGDILASGTRTVQIYSDAGGFISKKGDGGTWAWSIDAIGSTGTTYNGFGFYGSADTLNYNWIGRSYSDPWVKLTSSSTIINEGGHNYDFRVEGDSDEYLLFTDASLDYVGIGTPYPLAKLNVLGTKHVNYGTVNIQDSTSMAVNVGGDIIFGGKYTTAGAYARYGRIGGIKENSTDGNSQSAMIFHTNAGGSLAERMRITSDGNVGIGTNNPLAQLHVIATGVSSFRVESTQSYTYATLKHNSPNQWAYLEFNNDGVNRAFLQQNGTTTSNWGGPNALSMYNYAGPLVFGTNTTSTFIERMAIDVSGNITINDGGLNSDFRVEGDTDANLLFTDASTDSIGIGTSSPTAKLEIADDITGSGTLLSLNGTSWGDGETAYLSWNRAGSYVANIGAELTGGATNAHIVFETAANTERMRITSDGKVGIGTSSPSYKLDVVDGSSKFFVTGPAAYAEHTGGGDSGFVIRRAGANQWSVLNDFSDSDKFKINSGGFGGTTAITIDSSNNIGIGTSTPSAKLNVEGGNIIFNDLGGNYDFRVEGDTDQNLLFTDASTDRVGIGTASPSEKLHIDGGNVLVDGGGLTLYHTEPFIHQKSTDPEEAIQTYHYEGATLMGGLLSYGTSTSAFNNFNTFLGLGAGSLHLFSSYGHLGINTYGVDKDIVFGTDLTERARITSSGNVGIGTDTPNYKLDVHGTFSANSINVNDQFTFPTTDGSANQILKTDGNGNLSWTNQSGVGGSSGLEGTLLSASSSGVIIGSSGWVYQSGQTVLSQGSFGDSIGDAQNSTYLLRTTSADASWHTLLNNGKSGILLASNRTFQFGVNIVARRTDGQDNAAYKLEGLLYNDGYGCSIIGNPIKTVFGETDASWDVRAVIADSGDSNFLFIEGYGAASKIINWVAKVDLLEVGGNID